MFVYVYICVYVYTCLLMTEFRLRYEMVFFPKIKKKNTSRTWRIPTPFN